MELLDNSRNGELLYALYGLLMYLPQCHAFNCLRDRLSCLPSADTLAKTNRLKKNK